MDALSRPLAGDRSDDWSTPPAGPPLAPVLGCWHNLDEATTNLVRLSLTRDGDGLLLRAWGRGAPEPVDWGEVPAVAHAAGGACPGGMAFSARYDLDCLAARLVAYASGGLLVVETHRRFPRRSDRVREYFHR
jgi:hypothetical protein